MTVTTVDFEALSALEGLITRDVGEAIYELARNVPAGQAVVEIGAWKGKSTSYLAAGRRDGLKGTGGHVYSVDPWSTKVQAWSRYHVSASLGDWEAQLTKAGFRDAVTPLPGKSVKVAPKWNHGTIGFLYIDGDHAGTEVHADYHAWRPHLEVGSVVVFDDYGVSHNPEVAPAVHELETNGYIKVLEIQANGRIAVTEVIK